MSSQSVTEIALIIGISLILFGGLLVWLSVVTPTHIGRWVISREHPSERALRKWGDLTPELKLLISTAARSVAKDHIQDLYEKHNIPYIDADAPDFVGTYPLCRLHGPNCDPDCHRGCHDASHEHFNALRSAAKSLRERHAEKLAKENQRKEI